PLCDTSAIGPRCNVLGTTPLKATAVVLTLIRPKQLGPQMHMPCSTSAFNRAARSASSNPDDSTTAARIPRVKACSRTPQAALAGIAMTMQSTLSGSSFTEGVQG